MSLQVRVKPDSCANDMHPDFKKHFKIKCFAEYSLDKEAKKPLKKLK